MLKNIKKRTIAEAHRVSGRMNWDMTLDELNKFIELVIARAILGQRGLPVKCLWITTWRCFNVQQNCIKTQIQGNNMVFMFPREE